MNALQSHPAPMPPDPKPSSERFHTLSRLKGATLAYCKEWWQWRWSTPFDAALSGLDFRGSLEAWPKVSENEGNAYKVLASLHHAIEWALSESDWAKSHPHVGFHAQALKEAEPHLRAAKRAISGFAFATQVPVIQPTRREWITSIVEPRFGTTLDADELALYSFLAGFWPNTVPNDREKQPLRFAAGITVLRTIGEEKKNIRAALRDIAEMRRIDLAELEAYIARVGSDTES